MSERGNDYSAATDLPELVRRAAELADELGFGNSCAIPYGRVLSVLAAQRPGGRIGETGTGCGVGAAWMLSGKPEDAEIVTIEIDARRAAAVRELYSDRSDVTVLSGDWKDLGAHGQFDVLFLDGGGKREDQELAVDMVAVGGTIFLDDLTPGFSGPDPVRDWWLNSPHLHAVEILAAPEFTAIVAVKR